jgi:hypothetical protein
VVVTYEVDRWNLGLAHPGFYDAAASRLVTSLVCSL